MFLFFSPSPCTKLSGRAFRASTDMWQVYTDTQELPDKASESLQQQDFLDDVINDHLTGYYDVRRAIAQYLVPRRRGAY